MELDCFRDFLCLSMHFEEAPLGPEVHLSYKFSMNNFAWSGRLIGLCQFFRLSINGWTFSVVFTSSESSKTAEFDRRLMELYDFCWSRWDLFGACGPQTVPEALPGGTPKSILFWGGPKKGPGVPGGGPWGHPTDPRLIWTIKNHFFLSEPSHHFLAFLQK